MADTKLPLDYQLEHEQLSQRQALANAMLQKALTPNTGQMVGPNYASPGAGASFAAPILQALMAKYMMNQNTTDSAALATKYAGAENRLTPKDIFSIPGASLDSRRAAALANNGQGDPSLLAPDPRDHVINNQLVSSVPGQAPAVAGDFRQQYSPIRTVGNGPDGQPIQAQVAQGTGENKYVPGGGVNVNVDTGAKADDKFKSAIDAKRAGIISDSYDQAMSASRAFEALQEAKRDLASGIHTGATADIAVALSKVGTAMGMKADPATAATESYKANMARETLQLLKITGTNPSNSDLKFTERASAGDVKLEGPALVRLVNIAAAAQANRMLQHHNLLESTVDSNGDQIRGLETLRVPFRVTAGKNPGDLYFDEKAKQFSTVPTPEAPAIGTAQAPMTLDQYIKSRQGR